MIDIYFTINAIDYEATFQTVFPTVLNKCKQAESNNMLLRLLAKLDEIAEPVLQGIMRYLPQDIRDEFLCQCVNSFGPTLTEKLNAFLQTNNWGKNFVLGAVQVTRNEGKILLIAENVRVDYKALLETDAAQDKIEGVVANFAGNGLLAKLAAKAAKGALKAAGEMAPDELEKAGMILLRRPDIQEKLLNMIGGALNHRGIAVTLSEISVEQAASDMLPQVYVQQKFSLSPELEDALLSALAEYLRGII